MRSLKSTRELTRRLAGLLFLVASAAFPSFAQNPNGSAPNAAPSSDPTLTQTVNSDGTLHSVWKNPDGTLMCESDFTDHGGGETTRVAKCYQHGVLYYTHTYTTHSSGSSTSELVYAANNEKVVFNANPDGTPVKTGGTESASGQPTPSTTPFNPANPPIPYTVTLRFNQLDFRYEPTNGQNAVPAAKPPRNLKGLEKAIQEDNRKHRSSFLFSYEAAYRPAFSDPGVAILTSPRGTYVSHGIQVGFKFVYDVPFDKITYNYVRIHLPTPAPSSTTPLNEIKFHLNGVTLDLPGGNKGGSTDRPFIPENINVNDFTQSQIHFCPTNTPCTPGLNVTVGLAPAGSNITDVAPSNSLPPDWYLDVIARDLAIDPLSGTGIEILPAPGTDRKTVLRGGYGTYSRRPAIQIGGNGGVSFLNGNTAPTFNLYGSALWGKRFMFGPIAGYEQTSDLPAGSIGGHGAGQTFVDQIVRSHSLKFGAEFAANLFRGARAEAGGGFAAAWQTTQDSAGFCGFGNATSPAGCHVLGTTTTHNTGIGSFVQGDIAWKITHRLSLTTGIRYDTEPSIKSPSSSGSNISVNRIVPFGGIQYTFTREQHKGLGPFVQ